MNKKRKNFDDSINSQNSETFKGPIKKRKLQFEATSSCATLDEERGFSEKELKICMKVLHCFQQNDRIQLLKQERYKELRSYGIIFVEGISNKYFQGLTPNEYNQQKQKRNLKKTIRRKEKQEQKKLLAFSEIRKNRLKSLEKLTQENFELSSFFYSCPNEESYSFNPLLLEKGNIKIFEEKNISVEAEIQSDETIVEKTTGNFPFISFILLITQKEINLFGKGEKCYICSCRFWKVHHFYDRLCPTCAESNFKKRNQVTDLKDKYCLVTGGRIKIGYAIALKLLRFGANVIITTRFPIDAAFRYSKEKDFDQWKNRLNVYGLDLRFLQTVENFAYLLEQKYPKIDIIINNAAQTVRRPPLFYSHLIPMETVPLINLSEEIQHVVKSQNVFPLLTSKQKTEKQNKNIILDDNHSLIPWKLNSNGKSSSISVANLSQISIIPEDYIEDRSDFPQNVFDEDGQQIDLRNHTSWIMEHDEVSTIELTETHAINTLSPYILCSKLLPLMKKAGIKQDKFIVNVSSVEGLFYHTKKSTHPHTNMAKASLNMMTRTSASFFAKFRIWMNSVDTGWISDMNPISVSTKIAEKSREYFRNPLDCEDGAARVLDPIVSGIAEKKFLFGKMLKDYEIREW